MPKILEYQQRTTTPTGQGAPMPRANIPQGYGILSRVASEAFGDLARGVEGVADSVLRAQDEEARAWASTALSEARLKWTQSFLDRQANAQPNAPDFTPTILKDYDEYANDVIGKAPSPAAKKYLHGRLSEFRTMLGDEALRFEAKARMDWRTDQFVTAVDNTAKLMNTDPGQYNVALAERLAEIDSSSMPPVQKSALRQKAIDSISSAAVWSQIQKSPSAFLESIGFMGAVDSKTGKVRTTSGDLKGATGNVAFDALPFERRTQLFQEAVRLKAQIDADVDRTSAAKRNELADDAMKQLWGLHADGRLKRSDVEAVRPLLSAPQYHSALQVLRGEGGGEKSDPGTFRELQRLIDSGNLNEARQFAFSAHRSGMLSNAHLQSTVDHVRTVLRQEGPKSAYERGRQRINMSLDPGPFVQDPIGKGRYADAIDTFDKWFMEGKRTDKEVDERANEIVEQFRFIDLSETVVALPNPRSGQIRRNPSDPKGMLEDVRKVTQEVMRRRDAKMMDQATYENEMAILARWKRVIEGVGSKK